MRLPNGYGTICKLSGKRRKPYAVRISYREEQPNGSIKIKRKYLAYFEKKENALAYLADYNNSAIVPEHLKYYNQPTFAEIYLKWKEYRMSLKSAPGPAAWKNYDIAYNRYKELHQKKMISIKANDLQQIITANNVKSQSTVGNMRTIVKGMWKYAIANEFVDTDITQYITFEFTKSDTAIHTRFSDNEIKKLWDNLYVINNVDIILIYIYTGLRPQELLDIETENVFLDKKYMIGGMKTDAGRNRIIPLHDRIIPLIENRLSDNRKYLINNKYGRHYTRAVYHGSNFNVCMNNLNMIHRPHDTRYTFASLAENAGMNEICRKIIMGHSLVNETGTAFKTGDKNDVTKGIYTEKTIEELLTEINKIH